jgi:hypothetical protein
MLSEENMTNRTSRQFLRKFSQSGIGFLDRIITTDETWISCTVVFDIMHLFATSRTVKRLSPSITSRTSFFTTSEVLKDGLLGKK